MNAERTAREHAHAQALGSFFSRLLDELSLYLALRVLRHAALETVRRRTTP